MLTLPWSAYTFLQHLSVVVFLNYALFRIQLVASIWRFITQLPRYFLVFLGALVEKLFIGLMDGFSLTTFEEISRSYHTSNYDHENSQQSVTLENELNLVSRCQLCSDDADNSEEDSRQCSECGLCVCKNCSAEYALKTLGETGTRPICDECIVLVKQEIEESREMKRKVKRRNYKAKRRARDRRTKSEELTPKVTLGGEEDKSKSRGGLVRPAKYDECGKEADVSRCHLCELRIDAGGGTECTDCGQRVCSGCASDYLLKTLGESCTRPICSKCIVVRKKEVEILKSPSGSPVEHMIARALSSRGRDVRRHHHNSSGGSGKNSGVVATTCETHAGKKYPTTSSSTTTTTTTSSSSSTVGVVCGHCPICSEEWFERTDKRACTDCGRDVCKKCSSEYILKTLGETSTRPICSSCIDIVKKEVAIMKPRGGANASPLRMGKDDFALMKKNGSSPAAAAAAAAPAAPAAVTVTPTPAATPTPTTTTTTLEVNCQLCFSGVDGDLVDRRSCTECGVRVCKGCSQEYILKTFGETSTRPICNKCIVVVKKEVALMKSPRSLRIPGNKSTFNATAPTTTTTTTTTVKNNTNTNKCYACAKDWALPAGDAMPDGSSMLEERRDCTHCGHSVCVTCAPEYVLKTLGETATRPICSKCIIEVKKEIIEVKKEVEEKKEVSLKKSPRGIVNRKLKKSSCPKCAKPYDRKLRQECQCFECKESRCTLCAPKYRLVSLGEDFDRRICSGCVYAVKQRISDASSASSKDDLDVHPNINMHAQRKQQQPPHPSLSSSPPQRPLQRQPARFVTGSAVSEDTSSSSALSEELHQSMTLAQLRQLKTLRIENERLREENASLYSQLIRSGGETSSCSDDSEASVSTGGGCDDDDDVAVVVVVSCRSSPMVSEDGEEDADDAADDCSSSSSRLRLIRWRSSLGSTDSESDVGGSGSSSSSGGGSGGDAYRSSGDINIKSIQQSWDRAIEEHVTGDAVSSSNSSSNGIVRPRRKSFCV